MWYLYGVFLTTLIMVKTQIFPPDLPVIQSNCTLEEQKIFKDCAYNYSQTLGLGHLTNLRTTFLTTPMNVTEVEAMCEANAAFSLCAAGVFDHCVATEALVDAFDIYFSSADEMMAVIYNWTTVACGNMSAGRFQELSCLSLHENSIADDCRSASCLMNFADGEEFSEAYICHTKAVAAACGRDMAELYCSTLIEQADLTEGNKCTAYKQKCKTVDFNTIITVPGTSEGKSKGTVETFSSGLWILTLSLCFFVIF